MVSTLTSSCQLREKELSDIAANVCCQGAALLSGATFITGSGCRATCLRCFKIDGDKPTTVVRGTIVSGGDKQEIDMLIPVSTASSANHFNSRSDNCILMHPTKADVLTVLLLALPPGTWLGIRDGSLLDEIQGLVLTENLPEALQKEVGFSWLNSFFSLI